MKEVGPVFNLALKAVAMAMGVAVVVLSILGAAPLQTSVILLGIGLFALGVVALGESKE